MDTQPELGSGYRIHTDQGCDGNSSDVQERRQEQEKVERWLLTNQKQFPSPMILNCRQHQQKSNLKEF